MTCVANELNLPNCRRNRKNELSFVAAMRRENIPHSTNRQMYASSHSSNAILQGCMFRIHQFSPYTIQRESPSSSCCDKERCLVGRKCKGINLIFVVELGQSKDGFVTRPQSFEFSHKSTRHNKEPYPNSHHPKATKLLTFRMYAYIMSHIPQQQ